MYSILFVFRWMRMAFCLPFPYGPTVHLQDPSSLLVTSSSDDDCLDFPV